MLGKLLIEVHSADHITVAASWNNLGAVYETQGRYKKALKAHKEAKRITIVVHGADHIRVAGSWNNLGTVYYAQGRYEEALKAHEEAKRIRIAVHNVNHIEVADSWNNLGLIYVEKRWFEEARALYKQALKVYEHFSHSDRQKVANNLALSYIREGNTFLLKEDTDIEAAKECYQKSEINLDPIQPKSHKVLAGQAYNLSSLHATCEHLKILIKFDPHNASAYHELARLIHVYAKIEGDKMEIESYLTYLGMADDYFQQSITLHAHTGIYTEYAHFMLRNHSYYSLDNVIRYLDKALQLNQSDQYLSYRLMERITVDFALQNLIDKYNEIIFNAHHLAYYLLIQAYLLNNQLQDAKQTFDIFRAEAVNFKQTYIKWRKELSTQEANDKGQQLINVLLKITQQAIASYDTSLSQQSNEREDSRTKHSFALRV